MYTSNFGLKVDVIIDGKVVNLASVMAEIGRNV